MYNNLTKPERIVGLPRWVVQLILLIVVVVSVQSISAQSDLLFTEQSFAAQFPIDIYYWDDNLVLALQPRTDRKIVVINEILEQMAVFDPIGHNSLPENIGFIQSISWNYNGTYIAVLIGETINGSVLQVWKSSGEFVKSFVLPPTIGIEWSPQQDIIAVALEDRVLILNVDSEQDIQEFIVPGFPVIQGFDWRSDGSQIAIVNIQGVLQVYNIFSGDLVFELQNSNADLEFEEINEQHIPRYTRLKWEPNTVRLALLDATNSSMQIWDTATAKLILNFQVPADILAVRYGEGILITTTFNEEILFWNTSNGSKYAEVQLASYEQFVYIEWNGFDKTITYVTTTTSGNLSDVIMTISSPTLTPTYTTPTPPATPPR